MAALLGLLRPQRALLLGVLLLMTAAGLQSSLLGLRAAAESFGDVAVGALASAYFGGFLVGAAVVGRLIRRTGHVRAFGVLASAASALVLLHALAVSLVPWLVARLASGLAMGAMLVVVESWLNGSATAQTRGRLLSAYMVMTTGGFVIGQVLLITAPVEEFTLFALVSVLLSAALLPILFSTSAAPQVVDLRPLPIRELLQRSPGAVVTSVAAGATWGSVAGLAPVVAVSAGLGRSGVTAYVTAFLVGHLLSEGLVGSWSDRSDRRVVAAVVALLAAVGAAAGAFASGSTPVLLGSALFIGAGAFPLYSLSIALAGDRVESDEAVGAAVTLVRTNGIGAALTPLALSIVVGTRPGPFLAALAVLLTVAAVVLVGLRVGGGAVVPTSGPHRHLASRGSLVATAAAMSRRRARA